jgi:hypothetical protein
VITGSLVIDNRTGAPLDLYSDQPATPRCQAKWAVILSNGAAAQMSIFVDDCVLGSLRIAAGRSSLPVRILTTYDGCAATPATPLAGLAMPACGPGGSLPPLPAGDYQASVVATTTGFPRPAPVTVRLTGR